MLALLCSNASALPYIGPTRTLKSRWTTVHEARAESSSPTSTDADVLNGPKGVAIKVCIILFFAALLAFGVAMKCGWKPQCNGPRAALARRSRGWKRKDSTPVPAPALAVPTTEALTYESPTIVDAAPREHDPMYDSIYDKLDGWAPPPPPKDTPHPTVSSTSVGKPPHTGEAPRKEAVSEHRSHVEPTERAEPVPPPYPGKPAAADSWKQGTTTAADSEGWKQG
ncbi:hypothetical protein FRB90_009483 [Tulasnella sp. 427]|nr:hypothetical protein FRB90_009483 [Tulasnella sp. 427]